MRTRLSLLGLLLGCVGLASAANAELRSGESVVIGADETLGEDLYAAGGTVTVLGTIKGDLIAAAGTVTINGTVTGDVLSFAGTTNVFGEVRGSVRAASGDLRIHGTVGEDVVASSGRVELAPGAIVGRDLAMVGGRAKLDGAIRGDLLAAAGELVIAGPVGGDARAVVGQLRLEPNAEVDGSLSYRSERPAVLAEGAQVGGEISHKQLEQRRPGPLFFLWSWSRALIGLFALGVLLSVLLPRYWGRAVNALPQAPWKSLGIGALILFGAPVAVAFAFSVGILVGGWWIGLFALALYVIAMAASFPVVGTYVGTWLLSRLGRTGASLVLGLFTGLLLLTFTLRVPVLGGLVILATVLFGLGALLLGALETRRSPLAPA